MKRYLFTVIAIGMCSFAFAKEDPQLVPGQEWSAEYRKRGGDAYLWPREDRTLGIGKFTGNKKSLVPLAGLKAPVGITCVLLQGFEIGDADLIAIAEWKDIETLDIIDGQSVTDKGLKAVSRMPKLKTIALRDTSITGEGLSALSGSKTLTDLTISSTALPCRIRHFGLKELPKLDLNQA